MDMFFAAVELLERPGIYIKHKKNPNKLKYIYVLTPKGMSEKTKLTLNFMKRKFKEYEELQKEINKDKSCGLF